MILCPYCHGWEFHGQPWAFMAPPEQVVEELRRTPQGCEWLIGRWAMLARAADAHKEWTPDQGQLAFDLLGTPFSFRKGHRPGESIDLDRLLRRRLGDGD